MDNTDAVGPKRTHAQRLNFRAGAEQRQLLRQATEETDNTQQWVEFQAMLDAPLEPMPKLRRLLRRESPFAESD